MFWLGGSSAGFTTLILPMLAAAAAGSGGAMALEVTVKETRYERCRSGSPDTDDTFTLSDVRIRCVL